jgi:uncharacterized protein YcfL
MKKFLAIAIFATVLVACNNSSESSESKDSTAVAPDTSTMAPDTTTHADTTSKMDTSAKK